MERKVSARSRAGSGGVPHRVGNWLTPAADLLPARMEGRRSTVTKSSTAGAISREVARPARARCQRSLVVLSQPVCRDATNERAAGLTGDAGQLGSEGPAECHL